MSIPGLQTNSRMTPEQKEFVWYTVVGTLAAAAANAVVDVAAEEVKRYLKDRRKRDRKVQPETTDQETK